MFTFTKLSETRYQFSKVTPTGTILFALDSSPINNGMSATHGELMAILDSDPAKVERFKELLEWNYNFAFSQFCFENNVIIPPPINE